MSRTARDLLDILAPIALVAALLALPYLFGYDTVHALRDTWAALVEALTWH